MAAGSTPICRSLLSDDEAVILVADQQRGAQIGEPFEPLLGLLQQGFFAQAGQGPVLAWIGGA